MKKIFIDELIEDRSKSIKNLEEEIKTDKKQIEYLKKLD